MSSTNRNRKPQGDRNRKRVAVWGNISAVVAVVTLVVGMAYPQKAAETRLTARQKMSASLADFADRVSAKPSDDQDLRVIVQFQQRPQVQQFQKVTDRGGKFRANLGLINGGAFSLKASQLKQLAGDDSVAFISPDYKLMAADDLTDSAVGESTARLLGLDLWMGNIGVAVIDSGINDAHNDLRNTILLSRVVYHQDFTGTTVKNSSGQTVYDTYGHGTHVAGILAGDGTDSNGLWQGIHSGVKLVDLRVLDQYGAGSDSAVITAIQRAIALKSTYNIKIINLSLGRPVYGSYATDPLCQAVEQAWKAGITVVVAAGNFGRVTVNGSNGHGTITAPGNDPFVITVGAMKTNGTGSRADDTIASYSSKGPTSYDHVIKPDLVAPGNLIRSTISYGSTLAALLPANKVKGTTGSYDYMTLSGTSMATPVVSGAVALLLQQDSTLTPDQIKARLMKTANKTFPVSSVATDPLTGQTYTSYYDMFTVGAGYLDIAAAVSNTDKAPTTQGSALSPWAGWSNGTVSGYNGNATVNGNSVVWGSSVVWGTSVVWGNNVNGNSVVWGNNTNLTGTSVVWGNNTMAGFSVVWGSSNGTSGVAGSSVVWGQTQQLLKAYTVDGIGEN